MPPCPLGACPNAHRVSATMSMRISRAVFLPWYPDEPQCLFPVSTSRPLVPNRPFPAMVPLLPTSLTPRSSPPSCWAWQAPGGCSRGRCWRRWRRAARGSGPSCSPCPTPPPRWSAPRRTPWWPRVGRGGGAGAEDWSAEAVGVSSTAWAATWPTRGAWDPLA